LVFDKTPKNSSLPPPEYGLFSKKNIKEIEPIDSIHFKTNTLEVFMVKCNSISDSIVIPNLYPFYRSVLFYIKSFPCGGCPIGFINKQSKTDTLIYTFQLTDSCTTDCSPYHIFVEGNFASYKYIKRLEIVTMNKITDTIESTIKNNQNWTRYHNNEE
jgi:hypothetical protein